MFYNISFMGVDEADKLKEQGLVDFVIMAMKASQQRWSEADAVAYYNKIMTEAGLETETLPQPEITDNGNSTGNEGEAASTKGEGSGRSKRNNTGK